MALLPGYEQWGMAAVVIFVLLRFIDGIFLGGEYTAASPLAMEYCPREKRGLYGAVIMTGYPLAYATISLITLFLLFILSRRRSDSPLRAVGLADTVPHRGGSGVRFRDLLLPFRGRVGALCGERSGGSRIPPHRTFSAGPNLKNFLQVFVMMTGFWLTLYTGIGHPARCA